MSNENVEKEVMTAIVRSSELEKILKSKFGAEGTGLVMQAINVEHLLSPEVLRKLKWIGSVRNKATHDPLDFRLPEEYVRVCDETKAILEQLDAVSPQNRHTQNTAPKLSKLDELMVDGITVLGESWGNKFRQKPPLSDTSATGFVVGGLGMLAKGFTQYIVAIGLLLVYIAGLFYLLIGNAFGANLMVLAFWLAACYGIASLLTLKLYGIDRAAAQRDKMRMPEAILHSAELLGGWPILFISQKLFGHKTNKANYQFVFNVITIFHAAFIINIFVFHGWLWWVILPILFLTCVAILADMAKSW
jgi:uncharacterized membrane protein YsdA (DUF1294 family)